jgi:hypothetical protein
MDGATRAYYLETSFWGMLLLGQPKALRRDTQRLFAKLRRPPRRTLIGQTVVQEIRQAPPHEASVMIGYLNALAPRILELDGETEELAQAYIDAGILPSKKRDDARHVAAATLGGADVVVSWNYRHLVRPSRAEQFCAINLVRGYNPLLEISTPSEILHGPREDD